MRVRTLQLADSCSPAAMIVLLSPAKSLDLEPHDAWGLPTTQPVFAAEAEALAGLLAAMSQPELKALLGVSDDLTK